MATAQPDDWQGTGSGFEAMPTPTKAEPAAPALSPVPIPAAAQPAEPPARPTGPSETEQELMRTLAELSAELDAMREAAQSGGDPTRDDASAAQIDRLTEQLAALSEETDDLRRDAREADRLARERENQIRGLEAQLEAAQFEPEPLGPSGLEVPSGDPSEAERLGALEERRARAEAERQARVSSSLIAFGGSGAAPTDAGAGPDLGQNEEFLRQGARRAEVEQASVIANPSRTVIQGTVIQAVLETAIISDLPGAIRAVVSEDVHSYDGSRVLIPRGSKLIGRYNSQIEATQRRLMVAWDRIITPDGQSVTIAAYGADELGRSGTTGRIDRRLGTRFGSAALVSLISALPSAAAASADDPLAAELALALGEDVEDASRSVLDEYLSVAPTFYVDQGARITVMVDRDLELY
ncbi:conjugal transfer protein [Rubellimicrobium roseum]|uniref:Conjugal transfer protein n=1 Tax=Rubellimicrobium roseum TaxID=687525 RepID=A0A5C4N7F8_9RHOB|nr:conjugal transfer protein [Rubellimicrobium roseum]